MNTLMAPEMCVSRPGRVLLQTVMIGPSVSSCSVSEFIGLLVCQATRSEATFRGDRTTEGESGTATY